ncbi:MAG: methyltransferase domain-containing protein [Candidatus Omnitrophota bacterium]
MKKYTTTIYDLAFGGAGVGRVDGKICFVNFALPGEEVIFTVDKETSSYIKGSIADLRKASPDRTAPVCRYYGICGGCQYQHLSYEKELVYKKKQVEELMQRIGGLRDFKSEIVASGDCYNYRSSITLHKSSEGYGFCRDNSNEVVPIQECSIASKAINKILPELSNDAQKDRVTLKEDHQGNVWRSDKTTDKFFTDNYNSKEMFSSPRIFSQCNRYISLKIIEELNQWLSEASKDAVFFDVYCGAGFFSFLLPEYLLKVGIDYEGLSIECAKKTVKKYGLKGYGFFKGDVEKSFADVFNKSKAQSNILLLDPPRDGLDKQFLAWLGANKDITTIYYISCDPAKMARDIKILATSGNWVLNRFKIFDMFCRTAHIECLAQLRVE